MNKIMKHKKLLFILIPVLLVLIIVIVAVSGRDAKGAILEPTLDLRTKLPTSAALSTTKPDTSKTLSENYYLVAENSEYEMYLNYESLAIEVKDKVTGSIMMSAVTEIEGNMNQSWQSFIQSGVNVDAQVGNTTQQLMTGTDAAEIAVTLVDGGFRAKLDYTKYEFGFEMTVLLYDDGSIEVTIPEDSIYENSERNKIGNIRPYPMLGCTYLGTADGYMLVPDGNGAVIYLNDKENKYSSAYSQRVYGMDIGITEPYVLSLFRGHETINDPEYILAPVYGMVHSSDNIAFLAVITSGAEGATIDATPNGVYTPYNWIGARFIKRSLFNEPTSNSGGSVVKVTDRIPYDISIRYFFTRNEEASYAGLANRYRDYLLETGQIAKKDDGVFRVRTDFLGSDRENWMFTTKAVPMTTTDEIRTIYSELKAEGVTDIFTLYKGWQEGGVCSLPVDSLKADKSIGGTRDLRKLMEEAEKDGIQFYLYTDALRANPDTTNTTFNVIKKIDTRLYVEDTYKEVYTSMRFLTPSRTNTLVNNLIADFKKKDVTKLALTGITNTMFTYRYSGTTYDRFYTAEMQASLFDNIAASMDLVMEEPISTYWKYTNAIVDMPVKDSDYIFTEDSVPFLSIVFKGIIPMYSDYVNFEANKNEFFLKMVETGIYPSFYLTMQDSTDLYYTNSNDLYSSQYSVYKSSIIEYYNVLKEFNNLVSGSLIIDHKILEDGTVVVTYDNGAVVTINYKDYSFRVTKNGAEAMTYKVGGAE